jgi:hypothetical protein
MAATLTLGSLFQDAARAAAPTQSQARRVHILLAIATKGNNDPLLQRGTQEMAGRGGGGVSQVPMA